MTARTDQQVEEARRQLRKLLTRRDFLAATGVGALGLAGCSSGDPTTGVQPPPPPPPGAIPGGFQAVTGSVALPPGSHLTLTDLSVDVLAQSVPVSASSGFAVGITADGPALALLRDRNGDGVLMSVFDAGLTPHTISSHTTAVALLYYGTGAFFLPAAAMSQVLTLLDADPAVAGLASAVASAVAVDPHALANNAATLAPAVTLALQAIVGPALRAPASTSAPAIHGGSDVPTLILLNSPAEQNGVVASLDTGAITVLLSNAKRRPCKVYVYEVTTQTGNTISDVSPAMLVQGPFDLDSTQSLGVFNGLKAIVHGLNGEAPWTPVNLAPIPLTLAPTTADKTTFHVVVLSSALKWISQDAFEPAFFRDPHYVNELARWRADTQALWAMTMLGDLMLPALCFLGGFGAIVASRATIAAEVTNAAVLGSTTFRNIINTLHVGSLGDLEKGLAEVVQNAVNSELAGNLPDFWSPKIKAVVSDARAAAVAVESAPTIGSRLASGAKMFGAVFEPIFLAGFVLDGIDVGKIVSDFYGSEIGASWEVALYRQKLGLVPQDPRITGGERVNFRVSQPAGLPAGSFEYVWTQNSPFATLSGVDEANAGASITTTKLAVDLITTGSDTMPITVLVVGYDTSKTPRQEIGRAGTTVTFLQRAEILPANAAVDVGEQRLFSVNVDGTLPSGVRYRWSVAGTGGTIGGDSSGVITTLPQINFTGVTSAATDVLHVDVIDLGNNLIAKADAGITIARTPSIQFDVAGSWAAGTSPANGHYTFSDFADVRQAGNSTVDALLTEFDRKVDPAIPEGPNGPSYVNGVTLLLAVPTGGLPTAGQVFTKVVAGQPRAGQFVLSLSLNLADPLHNGTLAPGNSGILTVTSIAQLSNGEYVVPYTFNVSNGAGGTINGSGVARWK